MSEATRLVIAFGTCFILMFLNGTQLNSSDHDRSKAWKWLRWWNLSGLLLIAAVVVETVVNT
jgi:hypothetical protein